MAGVISTPIFVKDGQYLSLTCDNAVTLGNVVRLTATGVDTCDVGRVASNHDANLGVAVSGDRFSRTQTDGVISAGQKVTVCTRGVVNVLTGVSAILRGSHVESAATGTVDLSGTTGTANSVVDVIGVALDANGSAAATIRVALMRF